MLDLKKNAATIAAWILAFAAIGWMALDTFAAGSKINGATEIEDDLTTGSAGGVGLTGGTYDVSGSLGQVATMETQNGATELAGGYFAFPDITNLAASPGPFNGSVKLTWSWPESLTAGSSFYVQYSTFSAGMAWDASKAQVVRSTGPVTMGAGGATFVVGGLDTGRDGSDGDITPAYYFRVFSKPAAGSFSSSSNEASQAPVMPGILSTAAFVNFGTIGTPGGGWLQTVNGSANGSDIGYAVMHDDAENGAYVVGIFRGAGGNDDIFVRRYSPNGDTIWTKYYNGPGNGNDIARRIWVGNGQVYVVGSEARPDLAQSDNLLLINYSTAGVLQWTTTYNSPDNLADWGNGVDVDGAGITVAGMENRSTGGQNILVRRYNFEGSLLWSDTYDSGGSDYANQVKSDGAYVYVLGEAYGGSSNGQDLWMRKYSIAGVMQWTTTYNSPYNLTDRGMGLAVKFSDVFVVGDQYVDGSGNSDALYQKYGAADARLYTQVIDPSAGGKRTWHDVALDPGGLGVYVAGRRGPSTNTDIVVRKYDNAAGLEQWTTTYAGPGAGNDEGVGIFVSKSSNVYVTGYERRSAGQYDDAWVRRYNYDAFQSSGAGNTKTWKGVMNGAASDGTNWWEGFPPQTNDYVVFGATSPTNNCDWNLAVTLSSMTFKSGYAGTVTFSSQVVILQKFEMLTPDATAFFKYDPANPGAIKHRIEGLVDLATGTFKVERTTLTALNAVVVTSATFYLKDGAVFEGFELGSWDGAGMVRMAGPLAPVVTSTSPDSAIEFKLIDNVDISSGIFQRLNANGVQICSGANLVSFSSFTLAGPLLPGTTAINFYCGGVFTSTFTNINFADPNIAVNVGAQSLNNASRITMREAKGSQAGEAYDADPAGFPDVVEWPTATGGAAGISDLNASPGPNIGSVKLTWNWPTQLNSGSSYHVQYATYASAAWDISKAQITVSTGPVNLANGATIYVGGLDIGRDSADVDVSPVYYFRVFVTSNPAGSISPSSNQAQSAANTPPAQTNTPTDYANGWLRTTNNASNGYDEWHGVAVDAANDVYVAGHQEITPNNFGIILRKYNSLGNTLWTKWFDGNSSASDESYGIALSASGDLYVTGYFNSAGGFEDLLLRKYSPSGLLLWTTSYNSPDNLYDQGSGVAADANAVYVAGSSSRSVGGMNVLVRKYDHNGLSLWTTSYNNPGNTGDEALGLALYGGYLYVAGWTDVGGQAENWWLAKYDSNSLLLWTTTYNSPSNGTDMANAVAADASGVYVVGETSGGVQGPNVMVRKYDANALLVWTTTYNGPAAGGNDKAYGVALDASGVYVTGEY
ncbi:MAG: hypothetical protein HY748_14605, partial [Elusimicrobia bacterium]|nr:hypothetical protein [Elusimicrobiota bacterium]